MARPADRDGLQVALGLTLGLLVVGDRLLLEDSWWGASVQVAKVAAMVGLVWLLFERAAYPHRPPPWLPRGTGPAHGAGADTDADTFWPYRPRQGYPSVPAWLLAVLLFLGIGLLIGLLGMLDGSV